VITKTIGTGGDFATFTAAYSWWSGANVANETYVFDLISSVQDTAASPGTWQLKAGQYLKFTCSHNIGIPISAWYEYRVFRFTLFTINGINTGSPSTDPGYEVSYLHINNYGGNDPAEIVKAYVTSSYYSLQVIHSNFLRNTSDIKKITVLRSGYDHGSTYIYNNIVYQCAYVEVALSSGALVDGNHHNYIVNNAFLGVAGEIVLGGTDTTKRSYKWYVAGNWFYGASGYLISTNVNAACSVINNYSSVNETNAVFNADPSNKKNYAIAAELMSTIPSVTTFCRLRVGVLYKLFDHGITPALLFTKDIYNVDRVVPYSVGPIGNISTTCDFSTSTVETAIGESITFIDNTISSVNITAWLWTFGDGSTSSDQNPTHTYATDGLKTVSLTITVLGEMITTTKVDLIYVWLVIPDFSADKTKIEYGDTVTFTDTSIGEVPTAWLWVFGDGSTSTEEQPTHKYLRYGMQTVSMIIMVGGTDHTKTKTFYIAVIGSAQVEVPLLLEPVALDQGNTLVIPFKDLPSFVQEVTLDDRTYILTFTWNEAGSAWLMDMAAETEERLVSGIKLVLGYPLIRGLVDSRLPTGVFMIIDASGRFDEIAYADFTGGRSLQLTYTARV
jgi:PKD repeat protein